MSYLTVNNSQYFYQEKGLGNPLVLLHGFTGSSASWTEVIKPLSQNRRVITVDLPGHGQTKNRERTYSMESIADEILILIEHLEPHRVDLLGYSMGGRLALFLSLNKPEKIRSLILESASPGLDSANERKDRIAKDLQWIQLLESVGIHTFVDRWQDLPIFASQQRLNPQKFNQQRQQRLNNSPQQLANSLRWMGTGQQPSLWPRLAELNLPTLLVTGNLDRKYVAINQAMHKKMPNAKLQIVPNAGHNVHLEQPAAFIKLIEIFLKNRD